MATKNKSNGVTGSKYFWPAIAAVCLVCGLLIGHFAPVGTGAGATSGSGVTVGGTNLAGVTAVSEDQLDMVMGTYTYKGKAYDITVREVIETTSTLEASKNEDGTYQLPAADGVVSYARNRVIITAAEEAGVTVSDDEVNAYALEQLGSSDFASLASQYGLDEATVKQMISESALMSKYREQVTGTQIPTAPVAPDEPEEGAEDTATEAYANYVIELAGDAWDATNKKWADSESDYAVALANYDLASGKVTYEAAQAAYYVAYQAYTAQAQELSTVWTSLYNSIFAESSVTINTLVS